MSNLQIFNNKEFGEIRVVEIEGKIYSVGIDIAKALGYKDPNSAISRHSKGSDPVSYHCYFNNDSI